MKDIQYDLYRITGQTSQRALFKTFLSNRTFRKLFYFRSYQSGGYKKDNY